MFWENSLLVHTLCLGMWDFLPLAHSYAHVKVQALLLRRPPFSAPPWALLHPSTYHSRQQ